MSSHSSGGESHGTTPASHGTAGGNGHGHGQAAAHGHDEHDHIHPAPSTFLTRYVFSTDHKVIGIQFLTSGLIFFVLGGLLAMAVRWQLAWPWKPMPVLSRLLWSDPSLGYQMPPEFYNKLFTMHATIMIFFVIIPLLTGAFGNFLIPLMIGARDMAFPKLNMFSYWFMPPAMILITYSFFVEGGSAEAGWTSYPILTVARWSTPGSLNGQTFWLMALLLRRHLVALGVDQLHHDHRHAARARNEDVPAADDRLGDVHHGASSSVCAPRPDRGLDHAAPGPRCRDQLFQPRRLDGRQRSSGGRRRRSDPLPARLLVLFAPRRLRHDPAGDGHGLGYHRHVFAQAALRLQTDGLRNRRDRRARLHRLGPSHVSIGHEPRPGRHLHALDDDDRPAVGDQGLQLAGHALGRPHSVHVGDAQRHRVRGHVHHRRAVGNLHGGDSRRHPHSRHLFHRRPHSLRALRRQHLRNLRRDLLLVPQDVRANDE